MYQLEDSGALPSAMLAYRQGMSAHQGALVARLFLWWWCSHHEVFIIDWDESNAFCNVPRGDATKLHLGALSGFARWAADHYRLFEVRALTPHGASSPFPLHHGGAQGDSGGVGLFTLVSAIRTMAHEVIWRRSLHPGNLSSLPTDMRV